MDCKLPTRSDEAYSELNKLEKYAFTHCITYELARRNNFVENILNLLFELFKYYEQSILPILTKYEKVNITDDISKALNDIENIYKKDLTDLINHYKKNQFCNDFENLTLKNIKEKISYLANTLIKELYEKYYIIYQHESEQFIHDFSELYNPLTYLERDKTLTEHIKNTNSSDDLDEYYKFNAKQNEYFTVYQAIKKDEEDFSFSTIYPTFRTALRDFTDTKIVLNLHLSIDEIKDYIEKIKNDYDSKHSIIKTARQLLEEELEEYDDSDDIIATEKWSDIFFIYDYYHLCEIHTTKKDYEIELEIQIKLTKYHGLKIKKNPDEIKNKKDTQYKQVAWKEYLKNNPETDESNIYFEKDEKPYLSAKAIKYKYNQIKKYIEGENPKYKTLIYKHAI